MIVPNTYSEWNNILNIFSSKQNDEEVLLAMRKGSIEVQSGVYPRFIKKLLNAIQMRIDKANDQFTRNIRYANGNTNMVMKALLSFRKELCFLTTIVTIPAILAKDQNELINVIQMTADQIQESLEKSIQNEKTGQLSMIIKKNRVNKLNTEEGKS